MIRIKIVGVGWHTEYVRGRKTVARVDNVDIDKFEGSGVFGVTGRYMDCDNAHRETRAKLIEYFAPTEVHFKETRIDELK